MACQAPFPFLSPECSQEGLCYKPPDSCCQQGVASWRPLCLPCPAPFARAQTPSLETSLWRNWPSLSARCGASGPWPRWEDPRVVLDTWRKGLWGPWWQGSRPVPSRELDLLEIMSSSWKWGLGYW